VRRCAQAVVRDDRALLGETLHVRSLPPKKGERNKQREVPAKIEYPYVLRQLRVGIHMFECPIVRSRASRDARMLSHSAQALGFRIWQPYAANQKRNNHAIRRTP
jgi:hypothetical protein